MATELILYLLNILEDLIVLVVCDKLDTYLYLPGTMGQLLLSCVSEERVDFVIIQLLLHHTSISPTPDLCLDR